MRLFADVPSETTYQDADVQIREKAPADNWWSYLFRGAQQTPKNIPKVQRSNTRREWEDDKVEGFKGEDLIRISVFCCGEDEK